VVDYIYKHLTVENRTIEVGDLFSLPSASKVYREVNGLWLVIAIEIRDKPFENGAVFVSAVNKNNRKDHFWPEIENVQVISRVPP